MFQRANVLLVIKNKKQLLVCISLSKIDFFVIILCNPEIKAKFVEESIKHENKDLCYFGLAFYTKWFAFKRIRHSEICLNQSRI